MNDLDKIAELKSMKLSELPPSAEAIQAAKLKINQLLNGNQAKDLTRDQIDALTNNFKIIADSDNLSDHAFISVKMESKKIKYLEKNNIFFLNFWNKLLVLVAKRYPKGVKPLAELFDL